MKNIYLTFLLWSAGFSAFAQPCLGVIPDSTIISDFECQQNYIFNVVVPGIENPYITGINTSDSVGVYTDPSGPWDNLLVDYGAAIDLSSNYFLKIKVWTDIVGTGPLKAKLEGGTSTPIEKDLFITQTGQWTELVFDFSDQSLESHNKLVLFFNAGENTPGTDVYYIDDIRWDNTGASCNGVVADLNIISDFECQQNYDFNAAVPIIENPNPAGTNISTWVGVYTDPSGPWDNLLVDYGGAMDLTEYHFLKIKVLTDVVGNGPLKAKLEGGTSTPIEKDLFITQTGQWTELVFDFSDQTLESHNKLVLFFNAGENTPGTDVYNIDDIRWDNSIDPCSGVVADLNIISDFECQQNYTFNETIPIIENPNSSGINTSDSVGVYTDPSGPWDNLLVDYGAAMDLTEYHFLKIKVLTDVVGVGPLKAKLEGGTSTPIEQDLFITQTGQWTELTFSFEDQANESHNKLVLFFNAGENTPGTDVYYIDDIRWDNTGMVDPCGGVAPDLSIISDFECQQNYPFNLSPTIIDNPDPSGINTSTKVGQYDDPAGAWDNLLVDFGGPIDLSILNQIKIKVLTTAQPDGPLKVKLEGGTSAPVEIDADLIGSGQWEQYSFDFSDQASENHTNLVLFFNAGVDNSGTDIYYIDDILFEAGTILCDYDPANDIPAQDDPNPGSLETYVDFDVNNNIDIDVSNPNLVLNDINPDPTDPVNNSALVGKFTKQDAWDNVFMTFPMPPNLADIGQFKVKVYSSQPTAILLKLENGTGPNVESWREIDETDKWVEYSFDFSARAGFDYQNLVLFFDGGLGQGMPGDVYYFDEIIAVDQCEGITVDANIWTDFDCNDNLQAVAGSLEKVINPLSIVNSFSSDEAQRANVGKYVDEAGPWAPLVLTRLDGQNFDIGTSNAVIKIDVLTNVPGILKAKLENGSGNDIEVDSEITAENTCSFYTHSFDFSSVIGENYEKLVLFFNAGEDVQAGDVYYIDKIQGDFSTGIFNPQPKVEKLTVYPNPVNGQDLFVELPDDKFSTLTINSLVGQQMNVQNLSGAIGGTDYNVNISDLPKGIYLLTIEGAERNYLTKFIVQ